MRASRTEFRSIRQGCTVVSLVQEMHSLITKCGTPSEIVLPFNISHEPFFDMSHQKCYHSIEVTLKAKGDNEHADRF
jgi:hypothetical protein